MDPASLVLYFARDGANGSSVLLLLAAAAASSCFSITASSGFSITASSGVSVFATSASAGALSGGCRHVGGVRNGSVVSAFASDCQTKNGEAEKQVFHGGVLMYRQTAGIVTLYPKRES
jgi:hypothetical protein